MSKGLMVLLAILGVGLVTTCTVVSTGVGIYNSIQRQGTQVDAAASQIKVQLKRRLDLLPNLMSVVQGYATHERTTFTEIAQARSKLGGTISAAGANMAQLAQASQTLGGVIGRLLSLSENYPQLQANQNFRELQDQVEGTENRISVARNDYNQSVRDFNAYIKVFPNNMVAGFMGAQQRQFFEVADSTVENAPQLKFNSTDSTH